MKQRYHPMQGFGYVEAAARFCRTCEEVRHSFRPRQRMTLAVSRGDKRRLFLERFKALNAMMLAA